MTAWAGVIIAATHAILSEPAVDRLKDSPATDRAAHLPGDQEVFEDGSVTSMFDGHA